MAGALRRCLVFVASVATVGGVLPVVGATDAAAAAPTIAYTQSTPFQGNDGATAPPLVSLDCPKSFVLTSITLIADAGRFAAAGYGAGIEGQCTQVDATGTLGSATAVIGPWDGTNATDPSLAYQTACPSGSVVVGDRGRAGSLIDDVQAYCAPLTAGAIGSASLAADDAHSPNDTSGGSAFGPDLCPAGQLVNGIDARAGEDLDGIALRCATIAVGLDIQNLQVTATPLKPPLGPGATDVPVADIPSDAIPATSTDAVASAPLRSVPLRSVPLRSVPLRSVPLRSVPLRSVPLRSVLLSQVPLVGTTWAQQLAGTSLAGALPDSVTLDAAISALAAAGHDGPSLDQVDVANSPLANMSVTSVFLGAAPLDGLPVSPPTGHSDAGSNFGNWCLWFASVGYSCDSLGITGSSPVLAADLAGVPLRSVPLRSVPLRSVPVGAPLRSVPLRSVPLRSVPLRSVPLRSVTLTTPAGSLTAFGNLPLADIPATAGIGSIPNDGSLGGATTCSAVSCPTLSDVITGGHLTSGATLSQLAGPIAAGSYTLDDLGTFGDLTIGDLADDLTTDSPTLGDVLLSLLPPSAIDWESVPLGPLGLPAYDPSSPTVRYQVDFDVTGATDGVTGTATVTLPDGFRLTGTPGGLNPSGGSAESVRQSGPDVVASLDRSVPGHVSFSFDANPGLSLGDLKVQNVAVSLTSQAGLTSTAARSTPASVSVGDVGPAEQSESGSPYVVQPDHLVLGYISHPGDVDTYRLPVPALGTHVHVLLSHLPTDDDLVVYGPGASVSAAPLRSVPLRSVPLLDDGVNAAGANAPTPQLLNDVPVRSDLPVDGESVHHGTDDEEVGLLSSGGGGYYTIQVTGYNGASSTQPYLLRVVEDDPQDTTCSSLGLGAQTVQGALPAGTVATKSLLLVNQQQMAAAYGGDATTALMGKLQDFASRADVAGLVVPVDASSGVVSAYNSWNSDPCDVTSADGVVDAVNAVVRDYKNGSAPNLASVTLIGGDNQLPMYRTPDLTLSSNEVGYAESDAPASGDNPLSAAQKHGDMLTDDRYGSLQAVPWLGRSLSLPDLAVGRLVESPAEIGGQIDQFVTAGGALAPTTALTTGYDFLADGARAVDSALATDVSGGHSTLIDDPGATSPWTHSQLDGALFPTSGSSPALVGLNAHFDHNRALPSAGNATGDQSDLFTVDDITANPNRIPGRVLFSMGCHAGLNVPDSYVGGSGNALSKDWAQTFAQQKAIWVANTGYGLGDTASVALSEELMKLFAQRLNGSMTAGQALQYAKQAYFGELGAYGVYDEKAMTEPVFYGLPMWRVGGARWDPPTGTNPPAPVPAPVASPPGQADPAAAHAVTQPATDAASGLQATDITVTPDFSSTSTDRGRYWSVGGESQVTHYRPIQPRTSVGVQLPAGQTAHGSLILGLSSQDNAGVDPVFARPTIDLAANEPEASSTDMTFPTQFESLTSFASPSGAQTRLVMVPGQFFSGIGGATSGTQRLFTSMQSRVLFSSGSNSYVPPYITNAGSSIGSGQVTFTLDALGQQGATVQRALVLFHTAGTADWQQVDLTQSGDTWSGSAPVSSEAVEWFAEAEDIYGNVAVTDDKGMLFGSQTGFKADITGTTGTNGWYTSGVTIDAAGPAAGYEVLVDGHDAGPVPQTLAAEGSHIIAIQGSDNSSHSLGTIKIDTTAPTATLTSPANGTFTLGGSGAWTVACSDTGGSGPADCPGTGSVSTATVGGGQIAFTLHDQAGNAAAISLPYTVGAAFAGFSQPVNDPYTTTSYSVFKYASTIPLKFQLKNSQGGLMADAMASAIAAQCQARLSFVQTGSTTLPTDEGVYTDAADSGGCFRYDATAHQFIYNLGTKTLPGGGSGQKWALRAVVTVNNGTVADHAVVVGLK